MKHLMKLLFVPFLLFFSCTTQVDGVLNDGDLPQNNKDASVEATLHPVGISFSKSSIAAFAEEGISEIGIYVYMDGSLIYGEKQPLVHGAIEVPLPLGENLQTFVVANADEVADAGQLSTAVIRQNDNMQKPVYISEIIGFTSDNSVKSLDVELKRLVGQAVFVPVESQEEMDGITQFDALDITFTNVGVAYSVKEEKAVLEDVAYLKEGVIVNRTNGSLDTGIIFKSSKRSVVHMEILNEDWVETEWESMIEEIDF